MTEIRKLVTVTVAVLSSLVLFWTRQVGSNGTVTTYSRGK